MAIINLGGIIARSEKIKKDKATVEEKQMDKAISYIRRLQKYDGRLQDILDTFDACERYGLTIDNIILGVPIYVSHKEKCVRLDFINEVSIMYMIGEEKIAYEIKFRNTNGEKRHETYFITPKETVNITELNTYCRLPHDGVMKAIEGFYVMLSYMDKYIKEMTERFNNI